MEVSLEIYASSISRDYRKPCSCCLLSTVPDGLKAFLARLSRPAKTNAIQSEQVDIALQKERLWSFVTQD